MEPADARRMSVDQLFERQQFEKTLTDPNRFEEYYFTYRCFLVLKEIKKGLARDKTDKFGVIDMEAARSLGCMQSCLCVDSSLEQQVMTVIQMT
jgi:hypothetical protein